MTSCVAPVKKIPAQPDAQPLPQIKPGGRLYKIDNQSSQVLIEVSKTGSLANLGHNHLLLVNELQGRIHLYEEIIQSRVYMRFPVTAIDVDDNELRKLAGENMKKPIGKKDKQATYVNMLSKKVLNAEVFPFVSLSSTAITGTIPNLIMTTRIQIRDQNRTIDIPINLKITDQQLCVQGTFFIRQSDFAIIPFNVFLGALKVADVLNINFKVCAQQQASDPG